MNVPVGRLVLFAREPVPGRVKTRLAREVGAAAAASLYAAFLSDLAAALTSPGNWEAVLAYATMGEICGALRDVFGEYRPPATI